MLLHRQALAAHEASCGFAQKRCEFAGCGVLLRLRDQQSHDATHAASHARGERAARLEDKRASDAKISALESRLNSVLSDAGAQCSALQSTLLRVLWEAEAFRVTMGSRFEAERARFD